MGLNRNLCREDILTLKIFGKFITTTSKLTSAVSHDSLWRTSPLNPVFIDQLDKMRWCSLGTAKGDLKIGTTVKYVIEIVLGSLGRCPFYSIDGNQFIELPRICEMTGTRYLGLDVRNTRRTMRIFNSLNSSSVPTLIRKHMTEELWIWMTKLIVRSNQLLSLLGC